MKYTNLAMKSVIALYEEIWTSINLIQFQITGNERIILPEGKGKPTGQ